MIAVIFEVLFAQGAIADYLDHAKCLRALQSAGRQGALSDYPA